MDLNIRNVAIIAHVDHGKTTLIDRLLADSGTLGCKLSKGELSLDNNDQERERGITIFSKNTGLFWKDYVVNLVDTPGHADFGGEVERVLSMVDAVLLVVDAAEGPMPQTRFVTSKAFAAGLSPILIINKIDKIGADPDRCLNDVFDLFDKLGASDQQLDFPTVYCSAINGCAGFEVNEVTEGMEPILETIIKSCPQPKVDESGPFQMQISALDYNSYQGVIGIGRVSRGTLTQNKMVVVAGQDGQTRGARILKLYRNLGLERVEIKTATAGDIICVTGIDGLSISDTLCDPQNIQPMRPLKVDEPTVGVSFCVNNSPFAGQSGKFVTSRNLSERLENELIHNVSLQVQAGNTADKFQVSGRGELHLAVLIESMRREGFEIGISRPEVILRTINNIVCEPYEELVVECDSFNQGAVMEALGSRRGQLLSMETTDRVKLTYRIPSRGLIGFRSPFLTMTSGNGILNNTFDSYRKLQRGDIGNRSNGALISMVDGVTTAYSLYSLQERGRLLVGSGERVYEGMVIGIHSRANDLSVNPVKGKQLTNFRSTGSDESLVLNSPIRLSLEQALEFIDDDELVEVTPNEIRIRKKLLREVERKRLGRRKQSI